MQSFHLARGLVISYGNQHLEFTERALDELNFQNPENGKRLIIPEAEFWTQLNQNLISVVPAVASNEVLITPEPAKADTHVYVSDLDDKYVEDVQRKRNYIEALKALGISRGQRRHIAQALSKIALAQKDDRPPAPSTIQKWWHDFETSVEPNHVLINRHAYKQRRKSINAESEAFLQEQIGYHYLQLTRPTAMSAYFNYLGALKRVNQERRIQGRPELQRISQRSFYNRIDELPAKSKLVAREGHEVARKKLKLIKGHLPSDFPLDVVEIDHTPMNLYVVDDVSFLPLGRPTITAIKDRYSGMLLGFYITFNSGGLASIFGALKHSLKAHHLAYQVWDDLNNPWPGFGIGALTCSDRGADFLSSHYRGAILDLGSMYEYCERRTPWLKGSIERFFLTLERTFFETLPGRTFHSLAERRDYNPAKEAVIRFSTLIYLMHKWAVDYHNVLPDSRSGVTPLELWNEGVGFAPPALAASSRSLDIILGKRLTGTLQSEGLTRHYLHYADGGLQELMDQFGKGKKCSYIISPENVGYIHVRHPHTGEYFRVNSTRPEYTHGLTLFQHQYLLHEARLHGYERPSLDQLLETKHRVTMKIQEESFAKENARKKQLARRMNINSNAMLEGKQNTFQAPFGAVPTPSLDIRAQNREPSFTNIQTVKWGD